jgi:hypothetical protein
VKSRKRFEAPLLLVLQRFRHPLPGRTITQDCRHACGWLGRAGKALRSMRTSTRDAREDERVRVEGPNGVNAAVNRFEEIVQMIRLRRMSWRSDCQLPCLLAQSIARPSLRTGLRRWRPICS